MTFTCKYCNYSTPFKQNFSKHLNSKKHNDIVSRCKTIVVNEPNTDSNAIMTLMNVRLDTMESQITELKDENVELRLDNVKLRKDTADIRKDNAALRKDNVDLRKDNAELKEKFDKLNKKLSKGVNANGKGGVIQNYGDNNVSYINHFHVTLAKYGTELYPNDRKALVEAVSGVHTAIPNLVRLKHFDQRHPENNNLMIPNKKENKIQVFNGERWETRNKRTTLEDIFLDFPNFIDTDIGQSIYDSQSVLIREKLDKLRDLCEKVQRGDSLTREEGKEKKRDC